MSLVIVTNIVMLASVRVNRTGAPDATMTLTERELPIERTSERDSAQKLRLEQRPFWSEPQEMGWLTPEKLATLGVTCRQPTVRLGGAQVTTTGTWMCSASCKPGMTSSRMHSTTRDAAV
jgi:hypothetical protein